MIKYLNTRNSLCEKFILLSLTIICVIVGLDYKFNILPFHGVFLIAYLLFVMIITTWVTFICLQSLLQNNKPFEYDCEKNIGLKILMKILQALNNNKETHDAKQSSNVIASFGQTEVQSGEGKADVIDSKVFRSAVFSHKKQLKNIDERIDDFIRDIEVRFILKWYLHISCDPSFPSECKALLDEVIRRFLQIIVEVDGRKFVYGCIVMFLKHIKEFRKAVKRSQKNDGSIEELYRYSHVGSNSKKATEHFLFRLTANVLRQFISWELWNSLPCRSLVSILARKFTTYMLQYMSSPGFLNYRIIQMCTSESEKITLKLDNYSFISLSDVDHGGYLTQLHKSVSSTTAAKEKKLEKLKNEESSTPAISPRKVAKKIATPEYSASKQFDEVDSDKKLKQVENIKLQNGNAIENDTVKESQTPVKAQEMKFTPASKSTDTHKMEARPKVSEPVKIHESKSATKTWRNSSDLECISLGQDLLAFQEFTDPDSQIQELIEKKLWKDNTDPGDDEKSTCIWDIPEAWDGEDEPVEVTDASTTSPTSNFQSYLKSTANTASYITNTMKPIGNVTANTLHNMKEFQQSTVNTVNTVVKPVSQATSNAMHKIGDLQDEAAGMVEGILDFGMAGLRKGLRLTGLQENFTELTQKAKNEFQKTETPKSLQISKPPDTVKPTEPMKINEKDNMNHKGAAKLIKTPHVASEEKFEQAQSSSESDESVWINPLTKESPSFDGHILLEKTPDSLPKSTMADMQKAKDDFISTGLEKRHSIKDIPQITEDIVMVGESPDPEYEEPQDFASTIAKLRTLLQQKSSESGVTTPALSPMPHDDMAKTPNEPPPTDLTKVDGAMPSLYKFCARTATGVFQNTLNTIKTALPGNVNETNHCVVGNMEDWTFIEADSSTDDFYSRMKKLLSERRAYCTVDTAYEAIDSLEVIDQPDSAWTAPPQFDDELDEFDLQVPITKALVDIVCELIGDTNACLLQESVIKTILLLIGNYSEEIFIKQSDSLLHNVNKYVGKLPENINQDVLAMKLDEMVNICMELFPNTAKKLLGESIIETGVKLFVTSLQSQRINQDIFMQMFELFASELVNACGQVSPAYSA